MVIEGLGTAHTAQYHILRNYDNHDEDIYLEIHGTFLKYASSDSGCILCILTARSVLE